MSWWMWLTLGAVLLTVDLAVVGIMILFWVGLVAIIMGGLVYFFPQLSVGIQLSVFSLMSLGTILCWIWWTHRSRFNLMAKELMGETGVVIKCTGKRGSVRFQRPLAGRDVWDFRSQEDIPGGHRCVVTGVDTETGQVLVEPVNGSRSEATATEEAPAPPASTPSTND